MTNAVGKNIKANSIKSESTSAKIRRAVDNGKKSSSPPPINVSDGMSGMQTYGTDKKNACRLPPLEKNPFTRKNSAEQKIFKTSAET